MTKRLQRKLPGIVKQSLRVGLEEWHKRFLPIHFTRAAYSRYGRAYPKPKRHGDPFVESGTLRDRMLAASQRKNIRGTSRTMTLRMKFGRPPQYENPEHVRRQILATMMRDNLTWEEAKQRVWSRAGYHPITKARVDKGLHAMHGGEATAIVARARRETVKLIKEAMPKGKRRRRVKA